MVVVGNKFDLKDEKGGERRMKDKK